MPTCPRCNSNVNPGDRFCLTCGADLQSNQFQQQAPPNPFTIPNQNPNANQYGAPNQSYGQPNPFGTPQYNNPFPPPPNPFFNTNTKSDDQRTINFLLLLMAIRYGSIFLVWLISMFGMYSIYGMVRNVLLGGYIIALGVIGVRLSHKNAKILVWIMFAIELLMFIRYFAPMGYDRF